jgi:hypothetical protein
MSNELVPIDEKELGMSLVDHDDAVFSELAKGSDFLPRIQLYGGNSTIVKQGRFPMAHFALTESKDSIKDLTQEFDCLVISWKPKAMRFSDDGVLVVHDMKDPDFDKIKKDAEVFGNNCMWGPEFLLYLPSVKKFATFLMKNPTERREAPKLRALLGQSATIKSRLIESAKYSWHGPVVLDCATPFEKPPIEDIRIELEKFKDLTKRTTDTSFDPEELSGARDR